MLYYRAVITREMITGIYYILYTVTLLMILFGDGAEGAGGSTQVVVGLGSRWPLTITLRWSDRASGDHLGERWAWPWSASAVTS